MEKIQANKTLLLKLGTFVIFFLLYLLLQRLYTELYAYWQDPWAGFLWISASQPSSPEEYFTNSYSNNVLVFVFLVRYIQWALLGVLFYLLGLKEKPVFGFSKGLFILFLGLTLIYFAGTAFFYVTEGLNSFTSLVQSFFWKLLDEFRFLYFIIPALSGFLLMQSLFAAKQLIVSNDMDNH